MKFCSEKKNGPKKGCWVRESMWFVNPFESQRGLRAFFVDPFSSFERTRGRCRSDECGSLTSRMKKISEAMG